MRRAGPAEGPGLEVGESVSEYARRVLSHWPWLLVTAVALTLGAYSAAVSHVLAARTWMWFVVGFGAASVAQFLCFREVRRERNDALSVAPPDRVSLYAVAASLGRVPPPVAPPLDYQLHALRQALAFLDGEGYRDVDVRTLDAVLKRTARSGVQLLYEPISVDDCDDGLQHLVRSGELASAPEDAGYRYHLPPRGPA
jgi:hypothetical protein